MRLHTEAFGSQLMRGKKRRLKKMRNVTLPIMRKFVDAPEGGSGISGGYFAFARSKCEYDIFRGRDRIETSKEKDSECKYEIEKDKT